MIGTPKLPSLKKLSVKALLCALRGEDIRSKTGTEEFKAGPEFHVDKSPALATKPRRKGLGPKQLKWLRQNCQPFRDMESASKASKSGAEKGKK